MPNIRKIYNPGLVTKKSKIIDDSDIAIYNITYDILKELGWMAASGETLPILDSFLKKIELAVPSTWKNSCKFFDIIDYGISCHNFFYDDGENE